MSLQPKAIICIPVWGNEYIDRYLGFALPCFCARGNLLNLSNTHGYQVEFHYYTDTNGLLALQEHQYINGVGGDVAVRYFDLHDMFSDQLQKSKYDVITLAYEHSLTLAEPERDIYISLTADAIYSQGIFEHIFSVLAAGKRAVFCGTIRVLEDEALSALSEHRDAQVIDIDGAALLDIALNNLHPAVLQHNRYSNNFNIGWPSYLYWVHSEAGVLQRGIHHHPVAFKVVSGQTFGGKPSDSSSLVSCYAYDEVEVLTDCQMHCIFSLSDKDEFSDHEFYQSFSPIDIAIWMCKHALPLQIEMMKDKVRYLSISEENSEEVVALEAQSDRDIEKIIDLYKVLKKHPDLEEDYAFSWRPWESKRVSYGANWMKIYPIKVNEILKKIGGNIVVFGAGEHTRMLWRCTDLSRFAVAIADNDIDRQGGNLYGVPVISPSDIERWSDAVLISSKASENDLYRQLSAQKNNVEIYKIYEH